MRYIIKHGDAISIVTADLYVSRVYKNHNRNQISLCGVVYTGNVTSPI